MPDEKDICVFCKKSDSKFLYTTYDIFDSEYAIHKCNSCKAYFITAFPDKDILKKVYDQTYYGEQDEKFSSPAIEKILDLFRKSRAHRLSGYLKNNEKVLDIGCGNGRFLLYLLKFGNYQLYGTELVGKAAKRASRIPEINLKTGFLEKDDFKPKTFGVVTLFHVFEHLSEPKETLEIISEIIKKNGVLIISFPNIVSYQSKLFKGKWLHLDPPRHLFFFAPYDFISLMKEFGFQLIKQQTFSFEQNPYGMIQSILNCLCRKREVLFERLKGNSDYASEYSPLNIFFQKVFFVLSYPFFMVSDIFVSIIKKGATVEFTFRKV